MQPNVFEPVDPRAHRALVGASRVQVLAVLRAQGRASSVADVAGRVGLHPNTVRLHLDHLVDAGLAVREAERRDRPGRPRLLYAATAAERAQRSHDADREDGYRMLAEILAGQLEQASTRPDEAAVSAGRGWGAEMARTRPSTVPESPDAGQASRQMVALLDDLGFAPVTADGGQTVALHRCPFLQVAEKHSEVVCGVHLGLMQGAFAELRSPVQAVRLDPFVAPGLCLAHLGPAPRGSHA